jgi:selenocysteine-specific translation elongation factor
VPEAVAGQRTAINLQGIDKVELERGDVLGHPGEFAPTFMLDAVLQHLADAPRHSVTARASDSMLEPAKSWGG